MTMHVVELEPLYVSSSFLTTSLGCLSYSAMDKGKRVKNLQLSGFFFFFWWGGKGFSKIFQQIFSTFNGAPVGYGL